MAAALSSFTEFSIYSLILICVGSTERKGFSRPTLCLSFSQPFSFSPILQSFPRGVERATER